jgi:hypothetical protein
LTTAIGATATTRAPMTSVRKTALVAGALYLLTFISVPTLFLYGAVTSPNFILGSGPDSPVIVGGILEMIVALAGIGTAVVLFPVLKRQNESVALGLVGARTLEAATIFVGVACLLTVVTLRQTGVGATGLVAGHTLVALYNRMFLIGQSFMPVINDLLLGYLLYRSRLVPRVLPLLAFIGAALLLASDVAVLLGLLSQTSGVASLSALPIALFEFSFGVYLLVKGFKPSPILSNETRDADLDLPLAPTAVR